MLFEAVDETDGTKRLITEGGLPELDGTAEEVERAGPIRTRLLVDADDVLTRLRSDEIITEAQVDTAIVSPRQVQPDQVHAAQVALNRLRGEPSAAWWIAQESTSAAALLEELMKQGSP